jgi:hypothetical protein
MGKFKVSSATSTYAIVALSVGTIAGFSLFLYEAQGTGLHDSLQKEKEEFSLLRTIEKKDK